MANLLEKASIILSATAYKNNEVLCAKPSEAPYGDFDFTRNSSATRVNAQGLVEDVQILSSNLVQNGDFSQIGSEEVTNGSFSQEGSEQITNGDFSNGSTDWILSGLATIGNGVASFVDDGNNTNSAITQANVISINKTYKITFDVVRHVLGGVQIRVGNAAAITNQLIQGVGSYTIYINSGPTSGNQNFQIKRWGGRVGWDFDIDNVSVKEVGQNWTLGSGWSIGEDKIVATNVINTNFLQNSILTSGKTYKITYTIQDYTSGSVRFRASLVSGATNSSNGTYTDYIVSGGTPFAIQGLNTFNGSITNISVKEVGQNWTLGTGWSIGDNVANVVDAAFGSDLVDNTNFVSGKEYKVSFDVSNYIKGSVRVYVGNTSSIDVSANGSFTFTLVAFNTDAFKVQTRSGGSGTSLSVTNISVIEITDDTNLPRINYSGFTYQDSLGSEKVVNGSFDVNGNWSNFGTPLVSEQSSARYYTSPFSWYVNGDAFRQGIFSPNNFTLTNGKTYNVSLWVYALDGAEILSGLTNTDKSVFTSHAVTQNEWTNITYSAVANATSASYISILTSSSTLEFYIDNVSVKEYLGQEVVPDSGCGAWLFEPQSTNLITQSELFSDSIWNKQNSSVVSGFASPSGDLNAFKLINNTTASVNKYIRTIPAATSGVDYSLSVFAKKGEYDKLRVEDGNNSRGAWFDLSNGTFSAVGSSVVAKIEDYGNGWYRCSITKPSITTNIFFVIAGSNSQSLQVGDGTSGIYIWGAQAEQQDYATSYIPTEGTIKTRNQDLCINGGDVSLINSTEGVLYAQIAALIGGSNGQISLSDGTTNNAVQLRFDLNPDRLTIFLRGNGGSFAVKTIIGVTQTDYNKIALVWNATNFRIWLNGIQEGTIATNDLPLGLNTLDFRNTSGTSNFQGNTKALGVWKEALTDAELRSLTYPTPTAPTFDLDFNTIATDFTFTRNSEATFVNAQGLIQSTNELGAEEITNGDFSNGLTNWVVDDGTSWTNVNNTAFCDGNNGLIKQGFTSVFNKTYKVTFDVVNIGGGLLGVRVGSGAYAWNNYPSGSYVKYVVSGSNLSQGVLFYATSGWSGTIDNVTVKEYITETNTPRLDYSTGAEAFLLEPQSTNLITQSELFSDSFYVKDSGVSVGTTNNSSPSINANATKIDVTNNGRIYSNIATNTYYTSVFIKSGTFSHFKFAGSNIDLIAETNSNGTIQSFGNGWYRIGKSYTGNRPFQVQAYPDGTYSSHTTSGNYFIWGAQSEVQSYATSYIPTSGTTVTRNQELCYNATPVINSEEGVLYAEIAALSNDVTNRAISISDGTNTNRVSFSYSTSNNLLVVSVISSGSSIFNSFQSIPNPTNYLKVAISYKLNNFKVYINGSEVLLNTSGNTPIGLSQLNFNQAGSNKFFGNTKGLKIYPKALSDVELQDLTTI